jgi:hypothetical protein
MISWFSRNLSLLCEALLRISIGRARLRTETLYGAIRRLLDDGWIERFEQEDMSREKQA